MQQSALRSLAIVCDYMETTLFAIVCDLRFAIRDRLRSSAIIWKPVFTRILILHQNKGATHVVKSAEELGTIFENNVRGITLGIWPVWGLPLLSFNLSLFPIPL